MLEGGERQSLALPRILFLFRMSLRVSSEGTIDKSFPIGSGNRGWIEDELERR
jgi:hypothetical protein